MVDFSDRVVVVGGAAGNLGGAVAHAFDAAGARLGLLDRQPDRLQRIYGRLAENPNHLLLGSVDLTDPESVERAVDTFIKQFGRIDVLVNTTGGYRGGTPVHETPLETWDFMFALNLRTTLLACRAIVPHMLEVGSGAIVNVAARQGLKGGAKSAAYAAAKSAVLRLTESLSAELKHAGINVNCVLPGTIDTPENREAYPEAKFDRWVLPEAIADVILFLASDAARAIHGAAIPVYATG